jgi:formate-dependent nitrite reductase membrane component NrfD
MFEYMPYNIASWGIEIIIYFFLIGTSAMVFVVAAGPALFGQAAAPFKGFEIVGSLLALVILAITVPLLIFDISQPWRFLNPIIYFRWTSPLSWGSVLLPLFGLAILGFLYGIFTENPRIKRASAVIGALLALTLPIYTGFDLMVNQARELWASPLIPILFVVLSITSGAALVAVVLLLMGKFGEEAARAVRFILAFSIGATLWMVFAMITSMVAGSQEMQEALGFINSEFSFEFWWLTVVFGILVPLVLVFGPMISETMAFAKSPVMVTVAGLLGALGAFTLREVLIFVGQLPQLYF